MLHNLRLAYLIFVDALDREYKMAYSLLSQRELARLRRSDGPPKPTTVNCRRMFGDLEL